MARQNSVFALHVSQRKHHIICVGDMEFSNGFGIRWDCLKCTQGLLKDGSVCDVCGPVNFKDPIDPFD